jgi:hypothetical protein
MAIYRPKWRMTYLEKREEKRLNMAFREKYGKKKFKPYTKKQKSLWFKNLPPERRQEFIEKQCQKKNDERKQRDLEFMKQFGQDYACSGCLHRKTGSCDQDMPNGCLDFYSDELNMSFREIMVIPDSFFS